MYNPEPSYRYYIKYRIIGGGSDDFCPLHLTIHTTDGMQYRDGVAGQGWPKMDDWVDNNTGNQWRKATNPLPLQKNRNGILEWTTWPRMDLLETRY